MTYISDGFFAYARERYKILLRRRGDLQEWTEAIPKSGKWTNDRILQQYRFCNVFREDDKVTEWIRERITKVSYGDRLLPGIYTARWFNRIETLELMLPPENCPTPYWAHNLLYEFFPDVMRVRLSHLKPLVTGAYMVKTPTGMNKLNGIIWCMERSMHRLTRLQKALAKGRGTFTLEATTQELTSLPFLGPFMAYEIVTDLRHTHLLDKAPDIRTWANPGPGAARGLGRIYHNDPKHFNRHGKKDQEALQDGMQLLLACSQNECHWPTRWPIWEMREVEHTLCEFDKYERVRLGEGTPKQKYDGAR